MSNWMGMKSVVLLITVWAALSMPVALGWDHYGGSERGLQYSALDQIDTGNVGQLEEAWRYRTGELGKGAPRSFAFQTNPIMVEGSLYLTTATGVVIALDPASGDERWRFDPQLDRTRPTSETANRGVSSWIDSAADADTACRHRLFVGTLDARLIAIDGATGQPCPGFGEGGTVHLDRDVRLIEGRWVNYLLTSPPVIVNGVLVIGSAIGDNRGVELELGVVRGIDARSGAERWRWDPIPRDPQRASALDWDPEQARKTGAANAWAPLAADSDLGLVYVPTGSASPDYYGGERLGENRYANSLVALAAETGELVWHQQLVHHDVWDYDLPAQPTLADLRREGEVVPAVIQGTKMGLVFTFDRRTGEPIFAIEERPVPGGGVPGEQLSPTQPFPVAPAPLVRQGAVTPDDAWGIVLFDEWNCAGQIESARSEGIYTPPSLEGTINQPGYSGGINWGGVAFDPSTQTAVTNVIDAPMIVALVPRDQLGAEIEALGEDDYEFAQQTGTPYGMRRAPLLSPLGLPCLAPPWGLLVAIDMTTGELRWRVPLGTIEDVAPGFVPNLELGTPGMGGPLVTGGGLIFIGAAMDDYLRAFDLDSGSELWRGRLPAGGQATPMTYFLEQTNRQYVVIAAGGYPNLGTTPGDYVISYFIKNDNKQ